MSNTKVIDLELNSEGAYSEAGKEIKRNVTTVKSKQRTKVSQKRQDNSDTFLGGIDIGLDLIEKVVPRVERFLKLRG